MDLNKIYQGDCLDLMKLIPDKSIDMVLCDLPYGITKAEWDVPIPFDPLWDAYKRICKGAIVLFASQPFTSLLVCSNLGMFKYEWIWLKTHPKGHLNAKKVPLKAHESICVFYKDKVTYNPQVTYNHNRKIARARYTRQNSGIYGNETRDTFYDSTSRYPLSTLEFSNANLTHVHPSQKPTALFRYLIETYTNKNDVVLDNCIGSGTTAIAAIETGRNWIGMEISPEYCDIADKRIKESQLVFVI